MDKQEFAQRDKGEAMKQQGKQVDINTITLADQQYSPLLRLPAELRNKIYFFVFATQKIDPVYYGSGIFRCRTTSPNTLTSHPDHDDFNSPLSLTQVSRQIRAETQMLPAKLNSYLVRHPRIFRDWMLSLDKEKRVLVWERLSARQRRAIGIGVLWERGWSSGGALPVSNEPAVKLFSDL
ncbi:hypothetical protein EJ02DRAFT_450731 [Clathrospora elynae]|uniref:Uncharacterized protein n=1 Tax=Clathrospora elynae TaxID=706981 RepID=A0A6A5T6A7_9PLEO|nr:hypothetical protein EJ02DRAFT_450731 [Clathrospora elynae]